ncbi:MAG TPA: hypothetical protein VLS49_06440 [Usitatibacter sp.]|nr:hypothetical protein [Usitatibacter sp.]
MSTYQLRYHPARTTPGGRWLIIGFLAGAISVPIFHQGAIALLNLLQLTHYPLYSTTATHPWGIPVIWSQVFWGGVWGLVFAAFFMGLWGGALLVAGTLFGAFALSAVAWFVVAPIKGLGIAAGAVPMAMALGFIANAAWGFGTALGLVLFGRPRRTAWDAS